MAASKHGRLAGVGVIRYCVMGTQECRGQGGEALCCGVKMRTEDLRSIQSVLKANGKVQVFQQYGTCYIRWKICEPPGEGDSEGIASTRSVVLDAQGVAFLRRQGCSFTYQTERLFGRIVEEL